jgi:hypothetical protein
MLLPHVDADWSARIQAGTSALTALFAAVSLWFLWRYMNTTQATYQTTLKAYEEGTRPVLLLVQVNEHDSERYALYRNAGSGVAINICQTNMFTTFADDNVVAPNQQTTLRIPLRLELNVVELRYESLTGKKLCTISSFHKDGSIFNEYVPDLRAIGESGLSQLRGTCLSLAAASSSRKFKAQQIHERVVGAA